jgi:hypothetical protein
VEGVVASLHDKQMETTAVRRFRATSDRRGPGLPEVPRRLGHRRPTGAPPLPRRIQITGIWWAAAAVVLVYSMVLR